MLRRLPLLLLASLLLFGQLVSSALQLCLENDGSVTVELTLLDCGTVEVSKASQASQNCDSGAQSGLLESAFADLCLDFCFSLNLRKASSARDSLASFSARVQDFQPLGVTSICTASKPTNPRGYGTDLRGTPVQPWLEHGELLAKIHAREPVVLRC